MRDDFFAAVPRCRKEMATVRAQLQFLRLPHLPSFALPRKQTLALRKSMFANGLIVDISRLLCAPRGC